MSSESVFEEGMKLLLASPTKDLPLGFRCKFIKLMNASDQFASIKPSVQLGKLALDKILGDWDVATNCDNVPHRCLEIIASYASESGASSQLRYELAELWTRCDDVGSSLSPKDHRVMAGYAAVSLVYEHLGLWTGCDGLSDTEENLDPYCNDSAFSVSLAFGMPDGNPESDSQKRLEFWTWWLTEAKRSCKNL